ncbi:SET and MYND domain-containing protein 3 [Lobosporangium transversale]|nr:SET and MYND domain-containing protein 3 [Lobosporangium transversale]
MQACQIKDWKLHHQLECQGIQRSMSSPVMKEIWTKRTINTTIARALCRLIRRRERVKASKAYKVEHGKIDNSQKQVNEVYFSGLDQKEEEWLDEYGSTWIEQYLRTYEQEKTPVAATATNSSSLGTLEESSPLAKTLAIVMSCVVTPTEDRNVFLKSVREPCVNVESASGDSALDLLRKLNSYGFAITNMETTTAVGLALYVQCIPFMNHSCIPNCVYTFRGSRVECRVIRDIQPGEELTISYIDQIGTTQERQKQLKEQYRFTCDCPLCKYYPANPLAQPEDGPLRQIIADPLFEPRLDPKQGFVCSNLSCKAINGPKSILAIDSQLAIYNKVELKCSSCGHCTEITQELVQENEKEAQKLIAEFVREMNGGVERQIPKSNSRNFELAKVKASSSETPSEDTNSMERKPATAVIGGLKTVREPSARALKNFQDAFKVITGRPTSDSEKAVPAIDSAQSICRSHLHRLSRQLIQIGFDEAVSHKNWVFALHRSIELERLLNESYIGHHPLKAIQAYYTCKIANLLANLLLEESTVEIEDSEEEKDKDYGMLDSDDEADLKLLRDAMRKNGTGSMQEQLLRRKRKENEEGSSTGEGNAEDRRKKRVQEKEVSRTQIESSQQLQRYLQSLVPKIEDPKILVQVRTCWGKDGKLGSRYRCLIDSLKQALHYAALPFVSQEQKQKTI